VDPTRRQKRLHEQECQDADNRERILLRKRRTRESDQRDGVDREHPERGASH
jgi:hypothetical protein